MAQRNASIWAGMSRASRITGPPGGGRACGADGVASQDGAERRSAHVMQAGAASPPGPGRRQCGHVRPGTSAGEGSGRARCQRAGWRHRPEASRRHRPRLPAPAPVPQHDVQRLPAAPPGGKRPARPMDDSAAPGRVARRPCCSLSGRGCWCGRRNCRCRRRPADSGGTRAYPRRRQTGR
jgi:hypothetical protein